MYIIIWIVFLKPQNAVLNDVNRRDIENLIKGDNNESLIDDVIAAASSTTTAITSQTNQEDPISVTSSMAPIIMSTSTIEALSSQSPIENRNILAMSKTESHSELLDKTNSLLDASNSNQSNTTTTNATTITSIVSPIVIPSFKVGMGTINKETNSSDNIKEITHSTPKPNTFTSNPPKQGISIK